MVITIFGFIAPAVTLLLPILSGKIAGLRRKIDEEQAMVENIRNTLTSEYTSSLSAVKNPELEKQLLITVKKHVKTSTKPFDANLKRLKKNTRHLNLKWQITNIFGSLIVCLILVVVAHIAVPDFDYDNVKLSQTMLYVSIISLILSGALFVYALFRIWTLICIVVDHNSEIELSTNNNESKIVGSDK